MRIQETCLTAFEKLGQGQAANHYPGPPIVKAMQISAHCVKLNVLHIRIKGISGVAETQEFDRFIAPRTESEAG